MRHSTLNSLRAATLLLAALVFASGVLASPARLITSPPVQKGPNPLTGPPIDPLAAQGQWFRNNATGGLEVRPWEFYDNDDLPGAVGGLSIRGHVTNLQFTGPAPGGNLSGFSIVTTITNDLPAPDTGLPGRNQHGEFLQSSPSYQGTMFDVKMTTEFALPSQVVVPTTVLGQIAANASPYSSPDYGGQPALMIAQNEDQEAWYCFTNSNTGGFYVPTFDFGDIAPGQAATRTLNFLFAGSGISSGHPLYPQMLNWASTQQDVLMNRTTDLKIGDWVDVLAGDSGFPYPVPAFQSGNVSVFFNVPEPAAAGLLVPTTLMLLARRRKGASPAGCDRTE